MYFQRFPDAEVCFQGRDEALDDIQECPQEEILAEYVDEIDHDFSAISTVNSIQGKYFH